MAGAKQNAGWLGLVCVSCCCAMCVQFSVVLPCSVICQYTGRMCDSQAQYVQHVLGAPPPCEVGGGNVLLWVLMGGAEEYQAGLGIAVLCHVRKSSVVLFCNLPVAS